jgi:hypothetical protein
MAYATDDINYKVIQGDSFLLQVTYLDPDNNPIDLTGYQINMEIKDKPGGKILCASCSIGDGITLTDAANGIFDINISPEKTKKFNYPRASYQVQGTYLGENTTFIQGWFVVNAGTID